MQADKPHSFGVKQTFVNLDQDCEPLPHFTIPALYEPKPKNFSLFVFYKASLTTDKLLTHCLAVIEELTSIISAIREIFIVWYKVETLNI